MLCTYSGSISWVNPLPWWDFYADLPNSRRDYQVSGYFTDFGCWAYIRVMESFTEFSLKSSAQFCLGNLNFVICDTFRLHHSVRPLFVSSRRKSLWFFLCNNIILSKLGYHASVQILSLFHFHIHSLRSTHHSKISYGLHRTIAFWLLCIDVNLSRYQWVC